MPAWRVFVAVQGGHAAAPRAAAINAQPLLWCGGDTVTNRHRRAGVQRCGRRRCRKRRRGRRRIRVRNRSSGDGVLALVGADGNLRPGRTWRLKPARSRRYSR
jgi:hypothetical protein